MNASKTLKRIAAGLVTLVYLFISNGCEPAPKMIGYGNNEYSQLEFPGTNWNHQPLMEGYTKSWAGGNFNLSVYQDDSPNPAIFICKGDSSLGQCDLPEELIANWFVNGVSFTSIALGHNHGLAIMPEPNNTIITMVDEDSTFFTEATNRLLLWGDNSFSQSELPNLPDTNYFFQIAAGGNHSLAYLSDVHYNVQDSLYYLLNKKVIAWGNNTYGQCEVPSRFNPIADSLTILKIDAGANHSVLTYDSSGIKKIAAWGDNTYGQTDVLSISELNGNNTLLEIYCGYNHNVAITYNREVDYISNLEAGELIDTLIISFITSSNYYYGGPTPPNSIISIHPVSINAWGDNTFGQLNIPTLHGAFEDFDAGGYHNTIATTENILSNSMDPYYYQNPYSNFGFNSTGREITGWGRNDFGQTNFPIEYLVEWMSGSGGGYYYGPPSANSAPSISSGENHTIVTGSHLYRSPSMDYNFPDLFNGMFGDTLFQTITLKNIGPDTLYLDALYIMRDSIGSDSLNTHPFYFEYPGESYITYGDSISFQIYSIFDSSHAMNESAFLFIDSDGFFVESTSIPLNSYFGPEVTLNTPDIFLGSFDETIIKPMTIYNTGDATIYIDSIYLSSNNFNYEQFGEENYVFPGDSMIIYIYAILPDLPIEQNAYGELYVSNFNSQQYTFNLYSRRYLKVGDNMAISNYSNSSFWHCGPMGNVIGGYENQFSFNNLLFLNSKIHYFDFGYFRSGVDENYLAGLNLLHDHFEVNPSFLSMVSVPIDSLNLELNWNFNDNICESNLDFYFPSNDNVGFFQLYDNYFDNLFDDSVQSLVLDKNLEIVYLDTFQLDELVAKIQTSVDECGIECLSSNALNILEDTTFITIEENLNLIDTVYIQNLTDYDLGYSMAAESGGDIIPSVIFNSENHSLVSEVGTINSASTISFWFKPLPSNWSNNQDGYTNFISSELDDNSNQWKIILDNNNDYPRVGWKYGDDEALLSESPILGNRWYQCVFTHDHSNQVLHMFINGTLEGSISIENNIIFGEQLGINIFGPGLFTGFLSQTAFWSDILLPYEISYLYDLGPNSNLLVNSGYYESSSELILFWKFNESNGSTINDFSDNDFHASLIGNHSERWRTEITQLSTPWLTIMTGAEAVISENTINSSLIMIDANDLLPGIYYGSIHVIFDENPIINSQSFVKLIVTESLELTSEVLPLAYNLHQNYPNPFNPLTQIKYAIPKDEFVKCTIYDLMGEEVRSLVRQNKAAGTHSIQWNATNNKGKQVSAGAYFYSIQAGNFKETRKMILLK